jgi:uncharacterized membrane protein (DUF441 family)
MCSIAQGDVFKCAIVVEHGFYQWSMAITVAVAVAVAVAAAAAIKDVFKCSPVIKQYSLKPFPNLKTKH